MVVRQANDADISVVEDILLSAVNWMESNGFPQWGVENVKWENLSKHFGIEDFHIAYCGDTPVACMALIDYDPDFRWTDRK